MYWFLLACNADKENTTEDTVVETTEDTGEVEDSDTQDSQEDTTGGDTGEVEEPPPPPKIVRFVAMGDGGEGNETQYKVADVLKNVCEEKTDDLDGCEFVLIWG